MANELPGSGSKGEAQVGNKADASLSRVLVADDSELDRYLTIVKLRLAWPLPHEPAVECAGDGAEAWEKIRSTQFVLVVLDWSMPGFSGGEVLRMMRESGTRVPVVVVSGRDREEMGSELDSMSAAFISKNNMDPVSFRSAIESAMRLQAVTDSTGPGVNQSSAQGTRIPSGS